MDKYLATYKTFWWECIKYSLRSSFNIFAGIATALGVVALVLARFASRWEHLLSILWWFIPVAIFGLSFIFHMIRYPYILYKYQANKVQGYETQAIELEPHCRLEKLPSIGDVWVARIGVRALGLRVIRGVFIYLTEIDENQNDLFDAPLHPALQLRNVTGATNINPGKTQRYIEILHWNTSAKEMGIPYHLTAQLREANVDLSKSRDRLVDAIAVGTHNLTLYATGEDIKPLERQFRVEIVGDRLEIHRIENEHH